MVAFARLRRTFLSLACTVALSVPAAAQWVAVEPGGATVCSDGSPYRFFVHPGEPTRLLLEFEGGGGCWNDTTCTSDVYTRRITVDPEAARQQGLLVGIYDRGNPANPFRDWTHVYVPYCTGDLHWGDTERTYTGPLGPRSVQHRGAVNARAALAWAFENVAAPSDVFVTGCSAGGYGSIFWAPYVLARYPGASFAHLSDSAAGVVPAGFFDTLLPAWGVAGAWPAFVPGLDLEAMDTSGLTLGHLYGAVAAHHPLAAFAQFNTSFDSTQVFFYSLARNGFATPAEWNALLTQSIEGMKGTPNFFAYTAPGSQHCVINRPEMYTTAVGGVPFVDWMRRLQEGRAPGHVP